MVKGITELHFSTSPASADIFYKDLLQKISLLTLEEQLEYCMPLCQSWKDLIVELTSDLSCLVRLSADFTGKVFDLVSYVSLLDCTACLAIESFPSIAYMALQSPDG